MKPELREELFPHIAIVYLTVLIVLTSASSTAPYSYGLIFASWSQVTTFLRGCILTQLPIWNFTCFWSKYHRSQIITL